MNAKKVDNVLTEVLSWNFPGEAEINCVVSEQ
jgi:hypothetical protein